VNRFGELIGFTVLPALLDVAVAVVVFIIRFELALGVVVGVVMNGYIWISVVLTKYRTRIRKRMDDRDAVSTLCIINSPMQLVCSLRMSPLFNPYHSVLMYMHIDHPRHPHRLFAQLRDCQIFRWRGV
jgi:hypothetical protein